MAGKYSRILQAAKYYAAIDNYIKYITDSTKRGSRVGQGKARDASQELFLRPFGVTIKGDAVFAKTRVTVPTWDAYKGKASVTSRAKIALAGNQDGLRIENFVPAAVIIVTGKLPKGTPETSKVTGMKYLKYGGTSRTLPFGKGSSNTETEGEAFRAIAQEIRNTANNINMSLRAEKMRG